MLLTAIVLLTAFVVSWMGTKALIPLLVKRGVLDTPNERSSHSVVTPRGGGVGILLGITAGLVQAVVAGYSLPAISILIGALLVAATGFVDDWSGGLSVSLRFLVQTFAAGIVVFQTGPAEHIPLPAPLDVPLGVFAVPVTMLWIVGVINIYNFLDGIDGYAGAQGVIGGIALALCASEGSGYVTGLAIAGSCAGFLLHNWHKARVFMGDVGSATLGFLFATIPLGAGPILREQGVFVMSIALWFFLADGVFTLIRRLIAHEKIWEAHRSHLYQRLAASGYRHDHVVAGVMIPAFALCILGVVSIHARNTLMQWGVVLLAVTSFCVYLIITVISERATKPLRQEA